jgi:hypothetical protein
MVVDSDLPNYTDFIESVIEKYPPGHMEVAHGSCTMIMFLRLFRCKIRPGFDVYI